MDSPKSQSVTVENKIKPSRYNFVQIIVAFLTFFVCIFVIYKSFSGNISDLHDIIDGNRHLYPNGTLYFYSSNVNFNSNNYFSSIYVKGAGTLASVEDKVSILAILTCQGKSIPKTIADTFLTTPSGEAELYTSWYPIYESIVVELYITGAASKDIKPYLFVVKSTEKSAQKMNSINSIFRFLTISYLILYVLSYIFYSNRHPELPRVLSLIILIVAFVANLNYNHSADEDKLSIFKHTIFLMVRGIHGAVNLASVFALSMHYFSPENLGTAFLIAALYVVTEAMTAITTDSFIVSYFFDNNGIVWVFFFSTSIITKVTFTILTYHHLIMTAVQTSMKRKRIYMYFYSALLTLLVIPQIIRASLIIYNGYQSSMMNFVCEYVVQFIYVIFFVIIAWPSFEKPLKPENVSDVLDMDHGRLELERDVSVQFSEQP